MTLSLRFHAAHVLLVAAALLPAAFPSTKLFAQSAAAVSAQSSVSYLMIVETSRAMQPRATAVYDSVKMLIDSNFKGQLRDGDSFGIWAFSDTLDTNRVPFAPWSAETHLTSAMRAGRFSQADTYGGKPSMEKLTPELTRIIQQPGSVTILIYTTGKNEIRGTGLDDQINATFKQWQDQQQKANMPLVTLLQAVDGKITYWSVTPAPWPFEVRTRTPPDQLAKAHPTAVPGVPPLASNSPPAPSGPAAKIAVENPPPAPTQQPPPVPARETELKLSAPAPQPLIASAPRPEIKDAPVAPTQNTSAEPVTKAEPKKQPEPTPPPTSAQEKPVPATAAPAPKEIVEKPAPPPPTATPAQIAEKPKPAPAPEAPKPLADNAASPSPAAAPNQIVAKSGIPPGGAPALAPQAAPTSAAAPAEPTPAPAPTAPPTVSATGKPEPFQPAPALAQKELPPAHVASASPVPTQNNAPVQTAVATPQKSVLPENFVWLVCLVVVGIAAVICFAAWISSFRRSAADPVTLHDVLDTPSAPFRPPIRRVSPPGAGGQIVDSPKVPTEADSTTVQE